jgi:glycosyltransferase involved in cell wall biosynthesis
MKSDQLVSIIVPLYNKEETIQLCIDSALKQTYKLFELIIIDDGSTDKSSFIVNTIKDDRIRYLIKKNGGVSSARNMGIKESLGKWIIFLDADDFLLSNALEVLTNLAVDNDDVSVHVANYYNISENKATLMCKHKYQGVFNQPLKYFWNRSILTRPGNTLYERLIFDHIGGFDERISRNEDFFFSLKVISQYIISYSPIPIFEYNKDSLGLSLQKQTFEHELISFLKPVSFESKYLKLILFEYLYGIHRESLKTGTLDQVNLAKELLNMKFCKNYIYLNIPVLFMKWKLNLYLK